MDNGNFIDFKKSFKKTNLSKETMDIINNKGINLENITIGEFSGRDSAAAIIKAMESEEINVVLPIVAFTGTDYGDINIFYKNWEILNRRINQIYKNKTLLPLHFMFEPKLWNALNGRFAVEILKKYNYYTPCIGCHAYLRIIRIPLAKQLSGKIISGERIHHNNDFKIDQFKEVLEIYHKLCNDFDVELLLSVKDILDGDRVKEIIGYKWEQGKNQFSCVFSGNYRDKDGKVIFDKENILSILNEFTYPSSVEIIKKGYEGDFRYIEIVKNFI
ncbi:hypothetical protein [Methanothermococcus okinawensis]|uniref:Uncharacterized protein n=1 Tax=Methanothermococcus okinawensis (strain DSM 14208 / JCM 11175 / IH1) TaxID=647113 RepID=F8AKT5_METOI|nr:hypothetical protein [Methanothermococcus okinawensis]AEH07557.1 hypothetical protein Metok_1594 [Methanothermococcus okinawensis IH1]